MTPAEKKQIWNALITCTRNGYPGATYQAYDTPKDPRVRGGRWYWTRAQLYDLYQQLVKWGEANEPEAAWRELEKYKTKIPPACLRSIYQSITFFTPVLPTVVNGVVGTTTIDSADINNNEVTSDGGSAVTDRGVAYGIGLPFTTYVPSGSGVGNFNVSLTGLSANTKYTWSAYATNIVGTATAPLPAIFYTLPDPTTGTVGSITSSDAIVTGSTGGTGTSAFITTKGVCYSSVNNPPTTSDSIVPAGAGLGAFNSTLTGLTPSTTYYLRAYATNTAGTNYGVTRTFTTLAPPPDVTPTPTPNWADQYGCGVPEAETSAQITGINTPINLSISWFGSNGTLTVAVNNTNTYGGTITTLTTSPTTISVSNGQYVIFKISGASPPIYQRTVIVTNASDSNTGLDSFDIGVDMSC